MLDALFKFIAKNPPSIAMAGGILLMLTGNVELGQQIFNSGVLLQVLWLCMKYVIGKMI